MAELVDALVSGTSIRKYVQVRVLFWAQADFGLLFFFTSHDSIKFAQNIRYVQKH